MLAVNRNPDDRNARRTAVSLEKISSFLKRPVISAIPANDIVVNRAITKAVPVIASERDKSKSPIKELLELSDAVYTELEGEEDEAQEAEEETKKPRSRLGLLGR